MQIPNTSTTSVLATIYWNLKSTTIAFNLKHKDWLCRGLDKYERLLLHWINWNTHNYIWNLMAMYTKYAMFMYKKLLKLAWCGHRKGSRHISEQQVKLFKVISWNPFIFIKSPTLIKPNIHCFLVGRTGSYGSISF
jgi:hypothetical protein